MMFKLSNFVGLIDKNSAALKKHRIIYSQVGKIQEENHIFKVKFTLHAYIFIPTSCKGSHAQTHLIPDS